MGGLFDGIKPEEFYGSSYHVASLLGLPIILVLNTASSSYSIAAILRGGFQAMATKVNIAGVILNNVASDNHEKLLSEAIKMHTDVPLLGCVRRQDEILSSRHLGIKTGGLETDDSYYEACADLVDRYIDIEFLRNLAVDAEYTSESVDIHTDKKCLVAYDKAFNFYYDTNFQELRKRGYEIEFFSPLNDEPVDGGADLVYLGGGYPELYAKDIAENSKFMNSLKQFINDNKPVIAECGGMMILTRGIYVGEDYYPMVGTFGADCRMTEKRQALGYVSAKGTGSNESYVGHEFHYSKLENVDEPYFFELEKLTTKARKQDGFYKGKVFAGYTHFHFMSNPSVLDLLLGG